MEINILRAYRRIIRFCKDTKSPGHVQAKAEILSRAYCSHKISITCYIALPYTENGIYAIILQLSGRKLTRAVASRDEWPDAIWTYDFSHNGWISFEYTDKKSLFRPPMGLFGMELNVLLPHTTQPLEPSLVRCDSIAASAPPLPPQALTGNKKREPLSVPLERLAATYFSTNECSIIGDGGLNFSVRNGKRWTPTP